MDSEPKDFLPIEIGLEKLLPHVGGHQLAKLHGCVTSVVPFRQRVLHDLGQDLVRELAGKGDVWLEPVAVLVHR